MTFKKKLLISAILVFLLISALLVIFYPKKDSFTIRTVLIKLSIPVGGEGVGNLKIENNEDVYEEFNIKFKGINDFVSFNETNFKLAPKEFKELEITFKDIKNEPGVYLGKIAVESTALRKEIPVILSVEDPNSFFIIVQKGVQKYSEVYPGGKFGIEIKVFDTSSTGVPTVKAEHYIENFDSEILWSEASDLIIGGSITKIINIPNDWSYGDYVFVTSVEYGGKKSISNYLLTISEKQSGLFSADIKIIISLVLVFVFCVLALFFYFMKTRDNLLIELKKQQDRELKRNLELVDIYRKEAEKLKNFHERKRKIKQIKKVKKEIFRKIKHKQETQEKELGKLKKLGKKNEIKKKLKKWENQGFEMIEAGKEIKKISKAGINKQIKEWKKRGYNVSFLNQ